MSVREPYRPSNGTEGEMFISRWCSNCQHDAAARIGDGFDGCEILGRTFALSITDPEYPAEWREDGPSGPRCTAFLAEGDVEPLDPAAAMRLLL